MNNAARASSRECRGRPQRFCSTPCRNKWHNENATTTAMRVNVDLAARVYEAADRRVVSPRLIVEAALEQWFESVGGL